ncbi:hypothetical protein ACLOJK_002467 [Asimina triloba]
MTLIRHTSRGESSFKIGYRHKELWRNSFSRDDHRQIFAEQNASVNLSLMMLVFKVTQFYPEYRWKFACIRLSVTAKLLKFLSDAFLVFEW